MQNPAQPREETSGMNAHELNQLPKAAQGLVTLAEWCGWKTLVQWNEDSEGDAFVNVQVGRKLNDLECWHYRLTWHSRDTGTLRYWSGSARTPGRMKWRDAPSLTAVREVITSNPEPGFGPPTPG